MYHWQELVRKQVYVDVEARYKEGKDLLVVVYASDGWDNFQCAALMEKLNYIVVNVTSQVQWMYLLLDMYEVVVLGPSEGYYLKSIYIQEKIDTVHDWWMSETLDMEAVEQNYAREAPVNLCSVRVDPDFELADVDAWMMLLVVDDRFPMDVVDASMEIVATCYYYS